VQNPRRHRTNGYLEESRKLWLKRVWRQMLFQKKRRWQGYVAVGAEVWGLGNLIFLGNMSSVTGAGSGGTAERLCVCVGGGGGLHAMLKSLFSVLDIGCLPLPPSQSLVSDDSDLEVDFPSCSISPKSS
jgi:hypothetical protein